MWNRKKDTNQISQISKLWNGWNSLKCNECLQIPCNIWVLGQKEPFILTTDTSVCYFFSFSMCGFILQAKAGGMLLFGEGDRDRWSRLNPRPLHLGKHWLSMSISVGKQSPEVDRWILSKKKHSYEGKGQSGRRPPAKSRLKTNDEPSQENEQFLNPKEHSRRQREQCTWCNAI